MTFEERLDELAKSQQQFNNGLNHLLEVQARQAERQTKLEEAMAHLNEAMAHLIEVQIEIQTGVRQTQVKNELMMSQILEGLAQDAENIRALAGIAKVHDRRLNRLEGPGVQ